MIRTTALRAARAVIATLAIATASFIPARAQLYLVTSRQQLAGSDSISWGSAGPSLTLLADPFNITTSGGMNVNVSQAGSGFFRVDQDSPYHGNFAPRDQMLNSGGGYGPISLEFANAVSGVGAQIQADYFGGFTATIEAFDAFDNSLGSFSENGMSNSKADGSAIFIGVGSSQANIKKIHFSVSQTAQEVDQFTINHVDLSPQAVVPEGDAVALLAAGAVPLLFLTGRRWRKVRATRMSRVSWGS